MKTKVQTSHSLEVSCENSSLKSMSGQVASPEQQIDLVGFWEVGQKRLENQISFHLHKLQEERISFDICFVKENEQKSKAVGHRKKYCG